MPSGGFNETTRGGAWRTNGVRFPFALLKTATLLLTNAQCKALRATPVTIVAAPGAGKFIQPVAAMAELVYGGTNAFIQGGAGDNLSLKWQDGSTAVIMSGGIGAWAQNTASAYSAFVGPASGSSINVLKSAVDNKPLVVHNPAAAELTGNAGNDNKINIVLMYYIAISL